MNDELNLLKSYINLKIGVVGVGTMGTDISLAFENYISELQQKLNLNLVNTKNIFYFSDSGKDHIKKDKFKKMGFTNFTSNENLFKNVSIILIAVKPDIVESVLVQCKHLITENKIIVSIASGIPIILLETYIANPKAKIIRVNLNALCSIRESSSVYCVNSNINEIDEYLITNLFKNVGIIEKINEKTFNTFSGYSGAGPAYVYVFVEALIDGAIKKGIPYSIAKEFAIKTLLGACKLLSKNKDLHSMKYQIASPGGAYNCRYKCT